VAPQDVFLLQSVDVRLCSTVGNPKKLCCSRHRDKRPLLSRPKNQQYSIVLHALLPMSLRRHFTYILDESMRLDMRHTGAYRNMLVCSNRRVIVTVTSRYGGIKVAAPRDGWHCDGPARTSALLRLAMVQSRIGNKDNSFPPSVEKYRKHLSSTGKANSGPSSHFTLGCCWVVAQRGNSIGESAISPFATRERWPQMVPLSAWSTMKLNPNVYLRDIRRCRSAVLVAVQLIQG